MRAGIALGSNLGDRQMNLKRAREEVVAEPFVRPPILCSSIYETEPVDCAPDAPQFFNAVIEIDCAAEPKQLLAALRQIEQSLGRERARERNAPRPIDLDLLYFGDVVIATESLELPHPRMHLRRFVLEPLAEIRPDLILPNQRQNIATLWRDLPDTTPLVRIATEW